MKFAEQIDEFVSKSNEFRNQNINHLNELHIGLSADTNYARPLGVSITSIAQNNLDLFLIFHIFTNFFEKLDLERLKKTSMIFPNISMNIYTIDEKIIAHLPVLQGLPLATYYRFFMPLVLERLDKLLYLDSDVICLKSIASLVDFELENYVAATILDIKGTVEPQLKKLNLATSTYFNAGVLLINIRRWIAEEVSERAITMLSETPERFDLLDQDVLNVLLWDKVTYLSKDWNYIQEKKERNSIPSSVILLHCAARPKPWNIACSSSTQVHYLKCEKISQWSNFALDQPSNYREARSYFRKLFFEGRIIQSLIWLSKYLKMRKIENS